MYTHRQTHSSCYYMGANTSTAKKKSKQKISTPWPFLREYLQTSVQVLVISHTRTWSTSLLFTNRQMYELMLLGFPRHALFLILDDAFVWNFESEFWFTANCHFQLPESVYKLVRLPPLPLYSLEFYAGVCNELLKLCLVQLASACFMIFLRGLLTQSVVLQFFFFRKGNDFF